MERKLAAILVADIVGYSAQMEQDETGTFTRVTARRKKIFEPEISRHQGRIFKLVGDGLLAEFSSAVQAVECAIALQNGLRELNRNVPSDKIIVARIGINLGEVIIDGDDRLGDRVNIAARLEQLAEPGGICVSEKVAREVERKLAFGFESMGERRIKNIAEPIHVYRVSADATKGPRHRIVPSKTRRRINWLFVSLSVVALFAAGTYIQLTGQHPRSGPPVLAVLPFDNMSGDASQDYLGPGVSEDI
ncbi:MAG: cyaF4 [Cypionkella sp.]|uniref:adenylate/guanylate cyclase domain-containing protein n=1 Tax=Cypionkella sp. TaxID=2811411 RepID=UPI002636CEAB|nr:adenylate/guanylate cyclase domain-containing protein [Cypionkella sp.]MDB5659460.1 cyaF4 [Cypionkella sp.]